MNQTSDSLQVECSESFDGGLPQSFLMEIVELPTMRSRLNVSTTRTPPSFYAEGLEPGVSYRIMLYAINAKGKSDASIVDTVTFKGVAKYTGNTFLSVEKKNVWWPCSKGRRSCNVCPDINFD